MCVPAHVRTLVHLSMYIYHCGCACTYVCTCMRSQSSTFEPLSSRKPPISASQHWDYRGLDCFVLFCLVRFRGLNPGPHACTAVSLLAEPSPSPVPALFIIRILGPCYFCITVRQGSELFSQAPSLACTLPVFMLPCPGCIQVVLRSSGGKVQCTEDL